jgi:hypothetical protein
MIRMSSISENPGLRAISEMIGLGLGDTICIDAGLGHRSLFNFRFPQCLSLRDGSNTRST